MRKSAPIAKNPHSVNVRSRLLSALFAKAQNRGVDADALRDDIAPAVLGKRLSEANAREIVKLLDHVMALYQTAPTLPSVPSHQGRGSLVPSPFPTAQGEREKQGEFKRYPSSRAGLVAELEDVARIRWGADYEKSLNAFVNSNSIKAVTHYRFLNVAALKAVKERIKELSAKGLE
ncbi:hypothetical protein EPN18_08010 [bacterium]|nr:MAG: hypothetical protein EPN18_08010 [bacterium]